MKKEWIPASVMLTAGAITIFLCIYRGYDTLFSLKRLLLVLIIFLIIGKFAQKALIKIEEATPPPEDGDEKKAEENADGGDDEGSKAEGEEDTAEEETPESDNSGSQDTE